MKAKWQTLFPKHRKILQIVGENMKLATKRRKLATVKASERANIDRSTIEKGRPSVSFGAYFNVLRVLGLRKASDTSLLSTFNTSKICIRLFAVEYLENQIIANV